MKKDDTLVSVIIPTYKRDINVLDRAVRSVLTQTYRDIEIIIVDDNDPSSIYRNTNVEYLNKMANARVKFILNEHNLGGAVSRNVGVNKSTGSYISFLDDDDIYLPGKIENQLNYMKSNALDMCFTDLRIHNVSDKLVDYRSYEFIKDFSKNSLIKYHLMHHLAGTPTFMYQKECFVALNGFDNVSMGQEYYLMLKTIKEGYNIGYLPEAEVIAYRHNMGGISQGSNKINGEINLYLSKKQYFDIFNRRELRFIKFRHNAVLAIAYKRNKNYLKMIQKIIVICTVYLDLCITEIIKYVKKFKFVKIDI